MCFFFSFFLDIKVKGDKSYKSHHPFTAIRDNLHFILQKFNSFNHIFTFRILCNRLVRTPSTTVKPLIYNCLIKLWIGSQKAAMFLRN